MHELSIALSLVDAAAEEAERHAGTRVRAVHLKVGPLSGVVTSALLSAYELAREGSPLAAARLVVQDTPVTTDCPGCAAVRPVISPQDLRCAVCGHAAGRLVSGRELEVTALELEDV